MATIIELTILYTQKLSKIIGFFGVDSDITSAAFFKLQGIKMGIPEEDIHDYATVEMERVHQQALDLLPSMFSDEEL